MDNFILGRGPPFIGKLGGNIDQLGWESSFSTQLVPSHDDNLVVATCDPNALTQNPKVVDREPIRTETGGKLSPEPPRRHSCHGSADNESAETAVKELHSILSNAVECGLKQAMAHVGPCNHDEPFPFAASTTSQCSCHVGYFSNADIIGNLLHLIANLALFPSCCQNDPPKPKVVTAEVGVQVHKVTPRVQSRDAEVEVKVQTADAQAQAAHAEAQTADAQRELRTERHMASELQVQLDLAREGERKAVQAQDAASAEVSRARAEFQQSLSDFAKGGSEGDSALQRIAEAAGMSTSREQSLLSQNQELQAHVRELQDQLAFASKTALNWAPPNASGADKSRLERAIPDAAARAATAGSESMQKTSDLQTRVSTLQGELEHVRHQAAVAAAEHSRDLQRREQEYSTELTKRDVEAAARNAENRELKEMRAKENIGVKAQQQLGGSGQEAQLIEENRVLQEKLATIQDQTPANQRAQLQRLGFLEKTSRTLEAERSELLVRATVAEEQLSELQRHLKEMTKSYQMEIANLKLELQRAR